jgi:hypothetical protein
VKESEKMSEKKTQKGAAPQWLFTSDRNSFDPELLTAEQPSWATLPEADEQPEERDDHEEIPEFPRSITVTWAYFPAFLP